MIHIHNGDSIANVARRAGIPGRHLPFRETLISGPVRPNLGAQEWIEERARFLSEHYGENLLRVRNELLEQEQTLDRAREEEEVVLWFEHDLFCLINLLYLLSRFLLQASRFPSTRNGLGEVEQRALAGIEAGATDFASLFLRFDQSPPRFGFGDGEFLRHLRRLATCAVPMITITEAENETPPKALFALTPAGKNVLEAQVDFIELNNAGFWLGGAHLTRARLWRWDGSARRIVSQPAAS